MGLISRFIVELRRRAIFRTGGFYIGICWILVQVASIIYPTFDAPEWSMRATVIGTIVAFPIVLILAWFLAPLHQGVADGAVGAVENLRFGGRRADFAVIGVLAAALTFSIYLNLTGPSDIKPSKPVIDLLIGGLENTTGESVYDRTFERVLSVGLEESAFIATAGARGFTRDELPGEVTNSLDTQNIREIAFREGFDVLALSRIEIRGDKRNLAVTLIAPRTSEELGVVTATFESPAQFLSALRTIIPRLRSLLGDGNVEAADDSLPWLSDSDLYAWKAFADGDDLYFDRQDEEAIPHVRRAIQLSPSFQRAHATLGLIAMSRGDRAEAQRHFANAFEYLDQVTERERLRFQGLYYSTFRRDYGRAAEFFEQLVDTYPADDVGHSNLAVTYFYERDFNAAFLAGRKAIESYPRASMYLANYALFGMYATRLDLAINQAHLALQADPTNAVSWLPIAMSAMDVGDVASARAAYESMIAAAGGYQGKGLAADKASGKLGLADASIYSGRFESARRDLIGTAEELIEGGNRYLATTVYAATADSYGAEGRLLEAVSAAEDGLSLLTERESGRMYPVDTVAALHYVNAQRFEDASSIANSFGESASSEDRAIGLTLEGLIKLHRQEHDSAIQSFHSALQVTDLWLAHFMLGRAYLASGSYEKALDEFQLCHARRGEAMAMFLDDIPTYRMIVPLKYWTAQAQAGLGLTSDAISNLEGFLELRPNGGQYVSEARDLLNQLHDT